MAVIYAKRKFWLQHVVGSNRLKRFNLMQCRVDEKRKAEYLPKHMQIMDLKLSTPSDVGEEVHESNC